jgi:hypothetical protein
MPFRADFLGSLVKFVNLLMSCPQPAYKSTQFKEKLIAIGHIILLFEIHYIIFGRIRYQDNF